MRTIDSFKLSINSILHRRLRSWLTLLGIIIGVAAVVSIVSIGEGARASISDQLSGLGADIITVSPGFYKAQGFGGAFRKMHDSGNTASSSDEKSPTLTEKDSRIIKQNQNVLAVLENTSANGDLAFLAEETGISIKGVNPITWAMVEEPELAGGRLLIPSDAAAIVISGELAEGTFKQPITLGRRVSIEGQQYTVVGILEVAGGAGGFRMMGGGNNTVYMTNEMVWNLTDDETLENNTFNSISIKVRDFELIEQTMDELTQSLMLFRKVNENTQDFTLSSSLEIKEQINTTMESLTLFLGAIAAVSLIVGAVGVANSMFTSVLEKTREIGILKALGSTNNEILLLFIIESGLFGLAGGVIGVLIGLLVSALMSAMVGISLPIMKGGMITLVTPELMLTAITLSTAIGIISGIMPARAASKLKPVEALRYE